MVTDEKDKGDYGSSTIKHASQASTMDADARELESMGYKQTLSRDWSLLENCAP